MNKKNRWAGLIGSLLLIAPAFGQYEIIREGQEPAESISRTIVVPYAFSTETLGVGVGLGGTYSPKTQKQALYFGTAYATDNGSTYALLGGYDLQLPWLDRLFIRPFVSAGHFTHMRVYVDGNPDYTTERAGSNESSPGNYSEEDAVDIQAEVELFYVLPIGHYADTSVHTYTTRNGTLAENPSGAESWNPLKSGKTGILFRPSYRRMFTDAGTDEVYETLYWVVGLENDNCDFKPNPHRGTRTKFTISHDSGGLEHSKHWTTFDGELDGYIPLPAMSGIRQQTIALSAWGAYSPSTDLPPYFMGPTLGGFYRLRGYPADRFHDRAAVHYSAEYRVMPEWQPFGEIDVLDPLQIRWWQLVGLVEVGRVASSWDVSMLHQDMKMDAGIGLRMMFDKGVGRVDFVASDEGFSFVAMFGQTF